MAFVNKVTFYTICAVVMCTLVNGSRFKLQKQTSTQEWNFFKWLASLGHREKSPEEEKKILSSIFSELSLPIPGGTPCGDDSGAPWMGVFCSETNHVVKLDLEDREAQGDLAKIARDLQMLTELRSLNLAYTEVNGSIGAIARVKQLTSLNLADTKVTGDVGRMKNLRKLKFLDISGTNITGDIAGAQFGKMVELEQLLTQGAKGIAGDVKAFRTNQALKELDISETAISGNMSSLSGLTGMQILFAANTQLSGELAAVTSMKELQILDLQFTQVLGTTCDISPLLSESLKKHILSDSLISECDEVPLSENAHLVVHPSVPHGAHLNKHTHAPPHNPREPGAFDEPFSSHYISEEVLPLKKEFEEENESQDGEENIEEMPLLNVVEEEQEDDKEEDEEGEEEPFDAEDDEAEEDIEEDEEGEEEERQDAYIADDDDTVPPMPTSSPTLERQDAYIADHDEEEEEEKEEDAS